MRQIPTLCFAGLLLFLGAPAQAAEIHPDKYKVTPAEHAACDADAVSLCSATFPDEDKLVACMRAKATQLSLACSTAFVAGLKRRHMHL